MPEKFPSYPINQNAALREAHRRNIPALGDEPERPTVVCSAGVHVWDRRDENAPIEPGDPCKKCLYNKPWSGRSERTCCCQAHAGHNTCPSCPQHGTPHDDERIPGVTRHCSVCGVVVGHIVKNPGDLFGTLETTEAWGGTDLSEYRCKSHTQ